ncbi:MAG: OstA-like protein [Bacteroidota bacterium]|nr:OstA-like protein [Bacteroidota bacterium]
MKILFHTLIAILSVTLNAQTSKKIEILNADNTFANANKHPDYWRLIGYVSFKHNNAIMHCDSAYHYTNKNKMKAFGRIKITQGDSITLTGSSLTYFGSANKADIKGDVVLIDKYMTLKTKQIFYNLNSNIASYPSSGTIIDNEKTINSKKGEYHSNIYNFIFKDSVTVIAKDYNILTHNMHYNSNNETAYFFGPSYILSENKTIYCENGWYNTKTGISQFRENSYITNENYLLKGDSLYYNKKLGYGKAIKNVEVIDTIENITVFGNFAEYFEEEEVVEITETPVLQILFEEDTLFMHADKFISQQKAETKKVLAHNKVKFFKTDLQGKCDSLSYNLNDSIVKMFDNPILWSDKFQITADSIHFLMHKGKVNRMFLKPNPMIINQEDVLDYNQIKGRSMTAYFTNNKISRIDVEGNGQSIFIVTDEKTNDKIGLNYTESTDLILYFKNNKLDAVNYEIKPNSITTPYADIKEENRYLKGFLWRKDEQPKSKEDIFIE